MACSCRVLTLLSHLSSWPAASIPRVYWPPIPYLSVAGGSLIRTHVALRLQRKAYPFQAVLVGLGGAWFAYSNTRSAKPRINSAKAIYPDQPRGIPFSPKNAPAIWPYTAPVVSASSPRLTASRAPSRNDLAWYSAPPGPLPILCIRPQDGDEKKSAPYWRGARSARCSSEYLARRDSNLRNHTVSFSYVTRGNDNTAIPIIRRPFGCLRAKGAREPQRDDKYPDFDANELYSSCGDCKRRHGGGGEEKECDSPSHSIHPFMNSSRLYLEELLISYARDPGEISPPEERTAQW